MATATAALGVAVKSTGTGTTKLATVSAMFPELRGGSIYKTGRGRGGSKQAAIARAFRDLFTQVSGKRISIIKATITLADVAAEPGDKQDDE